MEDKTTCQILVDRKLEKLLNPPVKTNTFIKSYYEGLIFVFPTCIVITKARNTLFLQQGKKILTIKQGPCMEFQTKGATSLF